MKASTLHMITRSPRASPTGALALRTPRIMKAAARQRAMPGPRIQFTTHESWCIRCLRLLLLRVSSSVIFSSFALNPLNHCNISVKLKIEADMLLLLRDAASSSLGESMQCTVYSTQYAVHSVQCAVRSIPFGASKNRDLTRRF